jgi:hypothetical protein
MARLKKHPRKPDPVDTLINYFTSCARQRHRKRRK